ncbi:DnaD domain protein, partial [Virgibacillus xinjiangensis]
SFSCPGWINKMAEVDPTYVLLQYVKGILKAWNQKGIRTVDEAEMEERSFRQQEKRMSSHVQNRQNEEIVPDWFRDRNKLSVEKTDSIETDTGEDSEEVSIEIERLLAKVSGKEEESHIVS